MKSEEEKKKKREGRGAGASGERAVWKLTRGRGTSHSSNASAERSAEKEEGWLE
jgi:hypothetical protein